MSYKARHALYGYRKAKREAVAQRKWERCHMAVARYMHAAWDAILADTRPSFFQRLKEQQAKESGVPRP